MEKYIEDARQEEKDVPDLLEAIMRPTDPVKGELRQKLMNMLQFSKIWPEITKIRVWPERQKSQNGFADGPEPVFEAAHPFSRYLAPLGAKNSKKYIKKQCF